MKGVRITLEGPDGRVLELGEGVPIEEITIDAGPLPPTLRGLTFAMQPPTVGTSEASIIDAVRRELHRNYEEGRRLTDADGEIETVAEIDIHVSMGRGRATVTVRRKA